MLQIQSCLCLPPVSGNFWCFMADCRGMSGCSCQMPSVPMCWAMKGFFFFCALYKDCMRVYVLGTRWAPGGWMIPCFQGLHPSHFSNYITCFSQRGHSGDFCHREGLFWARRQWRGGCCGEQGVFRAWSGWLPQGQEGFWGKISSVSQAKEFCKEWGSVFVWLLLAIVFLHTLSLCAFLLKAI